MIIRATVTSKSGRILTDVVTSEGPVVRFAQRRHASPLAFDRVYFDSYVAVHILDPAETSERVRLMAQDTVGFTDTSARWPEGDP